MSSVIKEIYELSKMKTAVNLCVGNSFMGNLKFWYKDMSQK